MSIFDLQHRRTIVDMTNVFLFMSAISISFTWVSGIDVIATTRAARLLRLNEDP